MRKIALVAAATLFIHAFSLDDIVDSLALGFEVASRDLKAALPFDDVGELALDDVGGQVLGR